MKKHGRLSPNSLFLALLVWAVLSPAFAGFSDFFTVNGIYSRRISGDLGHENGIGTSAMLEFQALPSLSLGLGIDFINYLGPQSPGRTFLGSIDLISRIQFRANKFWTPYLMLGGGFNARTDFDQWHSWPWHCQLIGGAGTWYFLSNDTALDVGANYRILNCAGNPMQTLNARLGLSFFFGEIMENPVTTAQAVISLGPDEAVVVAQAPAPKSQTEEQDLGVPISKQEMGAPDGEEIPPPEAEEQVVSASAPEPQAEEQVVSVPISKQEMGAPIVAASVSAQDETAIPLAQEEKAEPTPAPRPQAEEQEVVAPISKQEMGADPFVLQYAEILTLKGDSVWDTSARREVYYDPELYPLIVDANKAFLDPLYVFESPVMLRFPTNATDEMKNQARRNAWTRKYQDLGGRRLIPWAYQRWLMNHDLPNNFQEKTK